MIEKEYQIFKKSFPGNLLHVDDNGNNALHAIICINAFSDEFIVWFIDHFSEENPDEFHKMINAEASNKSHGCNTFTPLALAAYNARPKAFMALFQKGALLKTVDSDDTEFSGNVLHQMIRGKMPEQSIVDIINQLIKKDPEIVKTLADEEILCPSSLDEINKFQGFNGLHFSVYFNQFLVFQALREAGISLTTLVADSDSKYSGMNLLHLAIASRYNDDDSVTKFIRDLHAINPQELILMIGEASGSGKSPLLLAAEYDREDPFMELVERGASLSASVSQVGPHNSMNLLHLMMVSEKSWSSKARNIICKLAKAKPQAFRQLLQSSVRNHTLSFKDWKGYTPTLIASAQGKLNLLTACLQNGATLNEKQLLLNAALTGQLEIIKFILKVANEKELIIQFGDQFASPDPSNFFEAVENEHKDLIEKASDLEKEDLLIRLFECKVALLKGCLPLDMIEVLSMPFDNESRIMQLKQERKELIQESLNKHKLIFNDLSKGKVIFPQEFLSYLSNYLFPDIRINPKIELRLVELWPFPQIKQIATLSFRLWRHRQSLTPQNNLAQNPSQCRDIIQHISATFFEAVEKSGPTLFYLEILNRFLQQPCRKVLINNLAKTNFSEDQIFEVVKNLIQDIFNSKSVIKEQHEIEIVSTHKSEQKEFAQGLGKKVFAKFFAANPTFPFTKYPKEKLDLEDRVYESLLENSSSLVFFKNNAKTTNKLIHELSGSDFSSSQIQKIIQNNSFSSKRPADQLSHEFNRSPKK